MKKRIVTISREFGSGGRTIGKMVADKLGYKFFDTEIIDRVIEETGLSREIVERYDEYATHKNSFLYSIAVNAGGDNYSGLSFANRVQVAQVNLIKKLADEGDCVIMGRGEFRSPSSYQRFKTTNSSFHSSWVFAHLIWPSST